VSTPRTLGLPAGVRRGTVESARGTFAVLEAVPDDGRDLGTALLVPGYTGSKEDFIAVLGQLAAAGRRVLAVDMRGQYQTPGPDTPGAYDPRELGKDVAALARATGAVHLLGHSFGGLVAREAVLGGTYTPRSLTLMCSGPAALPDPRAGDLRLIADVLNSVAPADRGRKVAEIWDAALEPQAVADGVPAPVIGFLRERLLTSSPAGLAAMAAHLLSAPDKTADLAGLDVPVLVLFGEDDDAWPPAHQEDMAIRLNARIACIAHAAHSPAVEAPAATAQALTSFWNATEETDTSPEAASPARPA
jgi:pimeloyl-ACP methyl ester carboxylesterase